MRVVATKDFRTYHRMVSVRVSKDQEFTGDFAKFCLDGGCPVEVIDDETATDEQERTPGGGSDEGSAPAFAQGGEVLAGQRTDSRGMPFGQSPDYPGLSTEPGTGESAESGPAPDPEPPVASDADGLDITGTAPQVLEWVSDDPDRARAAHEAESEKDKPRSTLLRKLEEIAGG